MAACSAAAATCLCVWHSVPERATYGTEYACRAQKGFLGYATHFQRHSVRKNRLLRYGRDIRCQKQASLVRDAFSKARRTAPATLNASSKARRTADSTDRGQPPAAPDASSVRETAPALFVRSGPFHHFLRPANAELVSGGPFPCSFDGTR